MDLVNAPSNRKTPAHLAEYVTKAGKDAGFSVKVWDKRRIEKEGMGALLAVNRGSEHDPVFIIMEYKGPGPERHSKIAPGGAKGLPLIRAVCPSSLRPICTT